MQDVFLNTYVFTTQVTRSNHLLKHFNLIIIIKRVIIMVITARYQTATDGDSGKDLPLSLFRLSSSLPTLFFRSAFLCSNEHK